MAPFYQFPCCQQKTAHPARARVWCHSGHPLPEVSFHVPSDAVLLGKGLTAAYVRGLVWCAFNEQDLPLFSGAVTLACVGVLWDTLAATTGTQGRVVAFGSPQGVYSPPRCLRHHALPRHLPPTGRGATDGQVPSDSSPHDTPLLAQAQGYEDSREAAQLPPVSCRCGLRRTSCRMSPYPSACAVGACHVCGGRGWQPYRGAPAAGSPRRVLPDYNVLWPVYREVFLSSGSRAKTQARDPCPRTQVPRTQVPLAVRPLVFARGTRAEHPTLPNFQQALELPRARSRPGP